MTQTFIRTLDYLGHSWTLLDRRFSRSVGEVGKFSTRKVFSATWMSFRLVGTLIRDSPDSVVLFATTSTFSFLNDWLLSEFLRCSRVRTVLYLHTVGFSRIAQRGRIWRWFVQRLLGSGDIVVTLGRSLAFDLTPWVPESKISFVPNTASDPPAMSAALDRDSPPTLLYLSNLIPEKGADVFVDSAIALKEEFPQVRFILAGDPADKAFVESLHDRLAAYPEVWQRFEFTGSVSGEEKWALLRSSDALVFTSRLFEAQPLTILEALSVGTAVVAFDVGGVGDVLRDGIDGHLIPVGNREALIAEMREFLHNFREQRDQRMALEAGYAKRFSHEAYAQNWGRILDRSSQAANRVP